MTQTTTTLRDAARNQIIASVTEAATRQHQMLYHTLHVHRDGTVSWFTDTSKSSDLIDDRAEHFAAIPSVIQTGTGSYACNCDHCNEVYNADTEALAIEQGRTYDRDAKYETEEDAISDAVADSDLSDLEDMMLAALDEIPAGYFDDEEVA